MACLLCKKSSDCLAKENECRDSVGKRCKSSNAGDTGPLTKNWLVDADLDTDRETDLEEAVDPGSVDACCMVNGLATWSSIIKVGARDEGSLRIRRRPDAVPASWSGRVVLFVGSKHLDVDLSITDAPLHIVRILGGTRIERISGAAGVWSC